MAALAGEALPVVVVNPAQVRHYAQALGKRAKTDPIDAAVIARFAEATKPAMRALPDEMTRQLGDLVARRRQIVEMLGAEGQRERRASDKRVKKSIARLRKALEKALADIDAEIDDNVRGSPVLGREGGFARFRSGRRPGGGAHSDCGNAGAWNARPPPDRRAGGPCALHSAIGPVEGQEPHRRRAQERARRPVHGRPGRRPLQSAAQGVPRQTRRRRKTQARRCRSDGAQAAHDAERHRSRRQNPGDLEPTHAWELRGLRRLHGGQEVLSVAARVKAAAAAGGGASAPALRRATDSDTIKASKSTLTVKTVAHPLRIRP